MQTSLQEHHEKHFPTIPISCSGNKRLYSDQRTQVRHFYLDADYFLKHFVQRLFLSIYDECSGGNVSLFPPRIYYIIIMRREGKQPPLFFFYLTAGSDNELHSLAFGTGRAF